jgi:hypothetical protein
MYIHIYISPGRLFLSSYSKDIYVLACMFIKIYSYYGIAYFLELVEIFQKQGDDFYYDPFDQASLLLPRSTVKKAALQASEWVKTSHELTAT